MPVSWKILKESGFDREPYPNCEKYGVWEATVDAAAYSNGSRTTVKGRGKRAGIHLYVRDDKGRRHWVYVILRSDSSAHLAAREVNAGDRIRLETMHTPSDHAWVKSLEKLVVPK